MPQTCRETFCESGFTGAELQRLVDELHPAFECEDHCCSPFSPGPVKNEETIGFLLVNPIHYDEQTKTVVPNAFRELTNRDLSTIRLSVSSKDEADLTREEIVARGLERMPPKTRTIDEVCMALVSDIRSANDDDGRLLAVYDTGLEGRPGHASIFTRADVLDDKKKRKQVRFIVHQIFKGAIIRYEKFRSSLS